MKVINPCNGEVIAEYAPHTPDEIEQRLQLAAEAFGPWRDLPISERARLLAELGRCLSLQRTELARLMTLEMGKPIGGALAEIDKCAAACGFFATHGPAFLEARMVESDAAVSYVRYDPLGPVMAIMPWNFPFWQVIRFLAPALLAGNVAVLKHAPNVPGCAAAIEAVCAEAGFPPGVLVSVRLDDNAAAERLIAHPLIRAITLTGSERAGIAVAVAAGKVLKKTVLELGGSDPFIVLRDADLAAAALAAAEARCINNGQSCIAAKRFIVESPVAAEFTARFVAAMRAKTVGNPMERTSDLGPLARRDLRDNLDDQVRRSIAAGATCLLGGRPIDGPGFFYPPTVLGNVRPGMAAFDEETFGPVAAIIIATDVDDAVRLANSSRFGLGASIWTGDLESARNSAARIDAGAVFINGIVKSDPRLPFGGIKHSGWGRELAAEGIHEFVNVKTVWVGGK